MNRHNAPSVVYPLGRRPPFFGSLLLGLWLAGLVSMLLWWNVTRKMDWHAALAVFSVLAAGILASISWNNMPGGQLVWDSETWRWESAGYQTGVVVRELSVIADFQHSLLLRLENQARASLWLWVEQRAMPERWLDLRRAVYSPHKSPADLPRHDFLAAETSSLPSPAVAASIGMPSQNVPRAEGP